MAFLDDPNAPIASGNAVPSVEASFPEMDAFLADQKKRHKTLIVRLMLVSLALIAGGVVTILLATGVGLAGGLVMLAAGAVGLVRGGLSLWTDIDTAERPELFAPSPLPLLGAGDEDTP